MAAKKTKTKSARKPAAKKAPKVAKKRGAKRAGTARLRRKASARSFAAPNRPSKPKAVRLLTLVTEKAAPDLGTEMKNQTDNAWITKHGLEMGTGIFLIPDPEGEQDAGFIKKVFVGDLKYSDCVQRGAQTIAFKWVPVAVRAFAFLQNHPCTRHRCVDRCVDDACVCNEATGECH